MHTVVTVTDRTVPALAGGAGSHYVSPPQSEGQARGLIRLLLGGRVPEGSGPWTHVIAGGMRTVHMEGNQ
jgi:hypothetical protein